MSLISTGSDVTRNTVFNAGYVTVDGNRLLDLENVSVTYENSLAELRTLNSIKLRALKRKTFKFGLKGKVKSVNKQLLAYLSGSSSTDGSGIGYTAKDGQQTAFTNMIFTTYVGDDQTQPVQYQFTGAIIKSLPLSVKVEDYAEQDFELEALDCYVYYGPAA